MSSPGTPFPERRVAVIIEDDDDIRQLLATVLTQAGFQTITAANGFDGVEAVRRYEPVVTTLDVNMPGMDGFAAARLIREFSSTYIVMLTALAEEIDTMQGFEAGADDYVSKPFRPRELRARIEAMLRRPRALSATNAAAHRAQDVPAVAPGPDPEPVPATVMQTRPAETVAVPREPATLTADEARGDGWLVHNGLWVNPKTRVVQQRGVELELTKNELDLLLGLMQSTRRLRTKADLVLLLRGESYVTSHFVSEADKRAVEVHLGNLRKKLGENLSSPRWIEAVEGVGYRLTAPD
ncbi:MAG: response regulator transcription factor [Rhodoglobus sp.]